ncbi:MAG TPA: hypothetical protein VF331_27850 [Polyangiales bacterium]
MIDFAREHRIFWAAVAAVACAGACRSGNNGFVSVGKGKGNAFDPSSLFDGGADGSVLDGSTRDGSAGGKAGSGALRDGGLIDGSTNDDAGPPEINPTQACSVAADFSNYTTKTDLPTEGGFALTPGPTGYGLVFGLRSAGSVINALDSMPVDSAGKFGTVATVLNDAVFTDVALLWNPSGWRMAWVDNFAGSREIETIALSNALKVPSNAMRTTLTNNSLQESRPVLADIAGVPLLAWIASDAKGVARISSARLDAAMKVVDLLPAGPGHTPASLALARMGKAGAALAWVEDATSKARGVWLQRIDDTGKLLGAAVQMSDQVSVGNSVDLATRDDVGGAALYSLTLGGGNHEVRFRRLDATGAFTGQDVKLIGDGLQATDASFARLGGGYVVVYRALPGGTVTKPSIRFMLISKEGNVTRDAHGNLVTYPLADSTGAGGRTRVQVSTDGQILVAFLDGSGNLRLARQRLDCGAP